MTTIGIIWIGNECNFFPSVAAVSLLVDLLLIDIKGHRTARSHDRYLILLTQADTNSRTITRFQCYKAGVASILAHTICTFLTNDEFIEAPIAIITKNHPTTFSLRDGQLHLEREIAEYPPSRTNSYIIVRLLADVIGPPE